MCFYISTKLQNREIYTILSSSYNKRKEKSKNEVDLNSSTMMSETKHQSYALYTISQISCDSLCSFDTFIEIRAQNTTCRAIGSSGSLNKTTNRRFMKRHICAILCHVNKTTVTVKKAVLRNRFLQS